MCFLRYPTHRERKFSSNKRTKVINMCSVNEFGQLITCKSFRRGKAVNPSELSNIENFENDILQVAIGKAFDVIERAFSEVVSEVGKVIPSVLSNIAGLENAEKLVDDKNAES